MDLLKKYDLIDAAKSNATIFKRILTECLGVKNEEVLIIGDEGYEIPGSNGKTNCLSSTKIEDYGQANVRKEHHAREKEAGNPHEPKILAQIIL